MAPESIQRASRNYSIPGHNDNKITVPKQPIELGHIDVDLYEGSESISMDYESSSIELSCFLGSGTKLYQNPTEYGR